MSPYPKPSPQQTFVYGTFLWIGKPRAQPLGVISPDIALEILREFSATEFVGKLYTKSLPSDWTLAQFNKIRSTKWYSHFEKNPKLFVFDMQGSGPWELLHFRTESDESGSYVAAALRQFAADKSPAWVKAARRLAGYEETGL